MPILPSHYVDLYDAHTVHRDHVVIWCTNDRLTLTSSINPAHCLCLGGKGAICAAIAAWKREELMGFFKRTVWAHLIGAKVQIYAGIIDHFLLKKRRRMTSFQVLSFIITQSSLQFNSCACVCVCRFWIKKETACPNSFAFPDASIGQGVRWEVLTI